MHWQQPISRAPRPLPDAPPFRLFRPDGWLFLSLISVTLAVVAVVMLGRLVSDLAVSRPLPKFVAAVNAGDAPAVSKLLAGDSERWVARSEWLATTGAVVSLSSCTDDTGPSVVCHVHFGDDWFFNRAAPPEVAKHGALATLLAVRIEGDQLRIVDFPLPPGLTEVEEPFRRWVMRTRPGSVSLMWTVGGPDLVSRMRIDAAGGSSHQALLAEYVDYLRTLAGHTPG